MITTSALFTWVVLPFLIFLARISDQSLGTLRMIFISKGYKNLAPFLGFFESLIWLLAIREILNHLDNFVCFIAYAAGFAMGNYIGILIDNKLSIGNLIVRVIPKEDSTELTHSMKEHYYGYTLVDAEGRSGKVKIVFAIIKRKDLEHFISLVNEKLPQAFYSVEEVKAVKEGIFRMSKKRSLLDFVNLGARKSK